MSTIYFYYLIKILVISSISSKLDLISSEQWPDFTEQWLFEFQDVRFPSLSLKYSFK